MAARAHRERINDIEFGYHFQRKLSKQSEVEIHRAVAYLRRYPLLDYKDENYSWNVSVDFSRMDTAPMSCA